MRELAKLIDKRIGHEQDRWAIGQSRMSAREWQALLEGREKKWDEAEKLSDELGFPYKDRNGVWRNTEPRDLVGMSLRVWCEKRNIPYS